MLHNSLTHLSTQLPDKLTQIKALLLPSFFPLAMQFYSLYSDNTGINQAYCNSAHLAGNILIFSLCKWRGGELLFFTLHPFPIRSDKLQRQSRTAQTVGQERPQQPPSRLLSKLPNWFLTHAVKSAFSPTRERKMLLCLFCFRLSHKEDLKKRVPLGRRLNKFFHGCCLC